MALLYPCAMGFPIHAGWSKVENDSSYFNEYFSATLPFRQHDSATIVNKGTLYSVQDLRTSMKELGVPRGILKKSASADSAGVHEWKQNLISKMSRSFPDLTETTLTVPSLSPKSPTKNVTFADDNNLSLVEVRNFVPSTDSVNEWLHFRGKYKVNVCESEESNMLALQNSNKIIRKKPEELRLCFQEPYQSAKFLDRFKHRCVALEKCGIRDRTVSGVVLVKNIEYHKSVFVRYTLHDWNSSSDTEACYVPNSNDGDTDRFMFSLTLPKSAKIMEFAICFKVSSNEFWDNNYNKNYRVEDVLANV